MANKDIEHDPDIVSANLRNYIRITLTKIIDAELNLHPQTI